MKQSRQGAAGLWRYWQALSIFALMRLTRRARRISFWASGTANPTGSNFLSAITHHESYRDNAFSESSGGYYLRMLWLPLR
jgi:hypothetical protein